MITDHDTSIYLAAHDLRAPLMSVKGLLNLIRQDQKKENVDYYVGLLEKSIDKMNRSITDLIAHSKHEQNTGTLQDVNLKVNIEDALQSVRFMPGAELVRIELSVPDEINFISDYHVLLNVFNNLISNAVRYRDSGKYSFLKISAVETKQIVEIIVEDNGIGIEEGDQKRIFQKFFLGNTERGGTGLGLYIVKTSIDKLEGSIVVESKIKEGTKFVIRLPNDKKIEKR